MPSGVLGSGSELEDDVSAPLTVKHMHWLCLLLGPSVNKPLTVKGMLDCGAHMVLINEALVALVGLCHFCLHKPLPISVAVYNTTWSDSHLHEYIKIAPFAPDSSYVSHTIKAVITPGLSVLLLLRLPFLVMNNIIADFIAHTTIDKESNIDLLQPPVRVRVKKFVEPSVSVCEVKGFKSAVLEELVSVCKEHL
jgi:hypothetical protein